MPTRAGKNGRHALVGLLRQSVFGRLAGYEDVNGPERLRHDPAMRWIVGGKTAQGSAASPSQMGRFETEWLASGGNFIALVDLPGHWIDRVHGRRPPNSIVLDRTRASVRPTAISKAPPTTPTSPAPSIIRCSSPDGTGFADPDIKGHRETRPIRAKGFRRWLARRLFEATGGAPSSEALQSALNVIEAKAHFDAPERMVHIRVGGLDGRLYLDLGAGRSDTMLNDCGRRIFEARRLADEPITLEELAGEFGVSRERVR